MASDVTQRRLRRRDAQQLFDELAADCLDQPRVSRAVMFGSNGLRVDARFFAFIGGDGQLIVKLPAAQAAALVSADQADPVRAGRNTMREWIGVPHVAHPGGVAQWRHLIADAYCYVASLTASSTAAPTTTG